MVDLCQAPLFGLGGAKGKLYYGDVIIMARHIFIQCFFAGRELLVDLLLKLRIRRSLWKKG